MPLLSSLLAILRFVAFGCLLLICVPVQMVVYTLKLRIRNVLPIYFHKVLTRVIVGLNIIQSGTPNKGPTLFLCNHLSYLDTISMASIVQTNFVAKKEVAHWPLFGYLTKLQGTVFVDRNSKSGAKEKGVEMTQVLKDNVNMVLFPEGTSTDGTTVRPFKSGLLQAVLENGAENIMVQPVSIAVYGKNGIAKRYPWYGDMTLMPHLWTIFATTGLTIRITFHDAFKASQFMDRKSLAEHAQKAVAKGPFGTFDSENMKTLPPAGATR